jgi:hypothetical protein
MSRNPIAKALRLLRPKRRPSGKIYRRKGRDRTGDKT